MSVTKLKTVGSWQPERAQSALEVAARVRGRVIIGMLTGGDASPDSVAVAGDPRAEPR